MYELDTPQILLLGCGYTLEKVAKSLPAGSFIATVQTEAKAQLLRANGMTVEICSLTEKESISSIFAKYPNIKVLVDSVPPLAGNQSSEWTAGVRNVIASLENSRLERIVYLSTTGVFGVSDGSIVDESTDTNPDNPKSQARLDCENLYRKSGIPTVALRIVGIYGPGRGFGLSLKHGRAVDLGPATRWTNRIHVEDLVAIIHFLLMTPVEQELPPIICAGDDEPAQVEEVLAYYREILSLPPPSSEEINSQKGTRSRTNLNQRVSNALMKSLTGLNLKYPSYREGADTEFAPEIDPT